jgi:hypothetical protein
VVRRCRIESGTDDVPARRNATVEDPTELAGAEVAVTAAATLLDEAAASERRWRLLSLHVSERLGLPLLRDEDQPPGVATAVQDAVHYHVTFDEDGARRVVLKPGHTAAEVTWPVAVASAPVEHLAAWEELAGIVTDAAVRARLHHLLFQARVQPVRHHALAATNAYLEAAEQDWDGWDGITFAYTALRLALAVGEHTSAGTAASAMETLIEAAVPDGQPGVAQRGLIFLALTSKLQFDFDALAERILPLLDARVADRVLAAMIERAKPAERTMIWERRVRLAVQDAQHASDGLVRTSKLTSALRLADRSGLGPLRREVAALLQQSGRVPAPMMTLSMSTRYHPGELEAAGRAIIGDTGIHDGLERWAHYGPPTGRAQDNRALTEERLAGSISWLLLPTQIIDENQMPRYAGTDEEEQLELAVAKDETSTAGMRQPVFSEALERLGARTELPNLSSFFGYLRTWPGFDDGTALMVATALIRFWTRDYDGAFYIALPQIERTIRTQVVDADAGVYRLQRDKTPGQFPGVGALLDDLAQLYDLDEDWHRYYKVMLAHPGGPNLRNLAAHGFMTTIHRDQAALVLHLLMHLGTLQRRPSGPPEP